MVIARLLKGKYRTRKNRITLVLFIIFLALPFIRFNNMPAILLDIPARIFYIFGLTIWPQEMYFLHVLLITVGIGLFFFTSLWGRIWCAYGCPQTVLTEVYDWIGRRAGGEKFGKKSAGIFLIIRVYIVWTILSLILGLVFLAYFKSFEKIFSELARLDLFIPESGRIKTWVLFWAGLSGFSLFIWGYFRENACKYVCPYGRFQTALLDSHSPIVAYDPTRGEPRREKGQMPGMQQGDCTACNLCQVVCPTGIDIREGLQVGCIRCGLCVDACTIEMDRTNKKTLIDMLSMEQVKDPEAKTQYIRPRTIIYGSIMGITMIVFAVLVAVRVPIYAFVTRNNYVPPTLIPGIGIQNLYELHLANMSFNKLGVKISLGKNSDSFLELGPGELEYHLKSEEIEKINVVVRYKSQTPPSNRKILPFELVVENLNNLNEKIKAKTIFSFPE